MSRIRGRDTGPERVVEKWLRSARFRYDCHAADLPGRPDFVVRSRRVVVLVDGDFWHGWRFPRWAHKLSPQWHDKIAANRARDARNIRRLRRLGWVVIRLWEHQINNDPQAHRRRVLEVLRSARAT